MTFRFGIFSIIACTVSLLYCACSVSLLYCTFMLCCVFLKCRINE